MTATQLVSRFWACGRKRRYVTLNYANQVTQRVWEQKGIQLFVYPCPYCRGYHHTKKRPVKCV